MRIAFVTSAQWPQLTPDDRLAAHELERRGALVEPGVWTDDTVGWGDYDAVVLRSCWDYFHTPDLFMRWIDRVEASGALLINPAHTLRWNVDKRYLGELAAAGVAVVPTVFAGAGDSLHALMAARGWKRAVLKPRVSADGHSTLLVSREEAAARQPELDEMLRRGGVLVQPYLDVIETAGELSFVFIGGRYSHAVQKLTSGADFRVQERYGGTVRPVTPADTLIAQAGAALAAVPVPWTYARVDGCVVEDRLLVMEVELLEPSLFLEHEDGAAARFAAVLQAAVTVPANRATEAS